MNWASLFPLPEDAVETGYEIGRNLRRSGAGKSGEKRKMSRWVQDNAVSPNIMFWRAGFRAGYRGSPKPDSGS
jgi:hypothetical protein